MAPEKSSPVPGTPIRAGIATPLATRLVCHGCGYEVPLDKPRPFRCPNGEEPDNVDHVLRRVFKANIFRSWSDAAKVFLDPDPSPFRRYRSLLYSYEIARTGGVSDRAYRHIVERLDEAVRQVDGTGFVATPFSAAPKLAKALELEPESLWIKDETNNVSGSHKARHLMGIMIWLEVSRSLDLQGGSAPPLAIASCGNAALAAAEVARAAGRPLHVFVPPDANPRVIAKLQMLGANLTQCTRREDDPPGDPCFLRFLEDWSKGALPFTVQGKRNGLTIEGGCTLVWEMVSDLLRSGTKLDHLFVQVGGGALATSCIEGIKDALALGLIQRMPRIHTVQTRGAFPLRRAYDRAVARIFREAFPPTPSKAEDAEFDAAEDHRRALRLRDETPAERIREALRHAATNRTDYMWPWESEPQSIAYGIVDDETYDWLAIVEGMLSSGGIPLVVSEDTLREAHRLGREHTPITAEPTGTAGLAGLLDLHRAGLIQPGETSAVLFTGIER